FNDRGVVLERPALVHRTRRPSGVLRGPLPGSSERVFNFFLLGYECLNARRHVVAFRLIIRRTRADGTAPRAEERYGNDSQGPYRHDLVLRTGGTRSRAAGSMMSPLVDGQDALLQLQKAQVDARGVHGADVALLPRPSGLVLVVQDLLEVHVLEPAPGEPL